MFLYNFQITIQNQPSYNKELKKNTDFKKREEEGKKGEIIINHLIERISFPVVISTSWRRPGVFLKGKKMLLILQRKIDDYRLGFITLAAWWTV